MELLVKSRDHLYGDAGDDRLHGKGEDDLLFGGTGDDKLYGSTGTDKYFFYTGGGQDTVVDEAEPVGNTKHQLGEIYFGGPNGDIRIDGLFTTADPDRKHYTFTATDGSQYVAAYLGDLATATPGNLVLWRADDGSNVVTLTKFISGDFGIVLDPNAPQRIYTDKFGTEQPDNEFILGGPHASSLSSDAPDQKVHGLGGADYIVVAHANAQALGGDGNDYAINGPGDQSLFGESGRDVLVASEGDDRLEGGADDDALQGGADADFLDGGEGHDVLDGGPGADVIAGGEGHDLIFGGGSVTVLISSWDAFADGSLDWGAVDDSGDVFFRGLAGASNVEGDAGDVITAGPGRDWVFAGDGLDVVSGGDDADYLVGQAGGDFLSGDDGDDLIYGDGAQGDLIAGLGLFSVYTLPHAHGDDSLRGGAGNDFLSGDGGSDELYGGDDDDILVGDSANVPEQFHGADYLDGGAGNDLLLGYGKTDTLFGGEGDDELGGDASTLTGDLHGNDFLDGEGGNDVLHGDGGADVLFGGAGNDVLDGDASNVAFEFHGDDELDGGEGDDALQGGGGSDWLFGGAGNDSLVGDGPDVPAAFAGNDYLDGEAGNDVLEAGAGNDTLIGGAGNDMLRGQAGDDLYLIRAGSQQEFIDDLEGANVVRFESGVTFAGINVSQVIGSDGSAYLYLQHGATDIAYVKGGLTSEAFRYEFADGSVKTAADWRERITDFASRFGTSGADLLSGTDLGDFFFPGNGNDTILFGPGSGYDRVSGFGQSTGSVAGLDIVQVTGGLVADDLDVLRNQEGHLTLLIRASGDRIQLDSWNVHASNAHAGYQVVFDDGSGLTAADLMARALVPGDGADVLFGGTGADVINGGAGDDWLYGNNNANPVDGGADHNVLLGGAGDDRIHGGLGDDVIDGGPGDDILDGSRGADTYRWGAGEGSDFIEGGGLGEGNVLELKAGIGPQDLALTQGSIVVYINATGESLTLEDWYGESGPPTAHTPYVTVEAFHFADGTVWDATLINEMANHATPFDDDLRGIFTADVLHGLGGNDTLQGFAGDDVLHGGDGVDKLDGGGGADELVGGAGNDFLSGDAVGDLLIGAAGDDLLSGLGGQNVYRFGPGDGVDRIVGMGDGDAFVFAAAIDATDVRIVSDGATLTVDYGSGRVSIALGAAGDHAAHGLALARFAGGEEWSREEILARTEVEVKPLAGGAGSDTLVGTTGDDVLLGGDGSDALNGNDGDDFLDGGAGDDQMSGGRGSDTYRFGADTGHDSLNDARRDLLFQASWPEDADVIEVDAGISSADVAVSRDGNHLVLETATSSLLLTNWLASELGPGALEVRFADGTAWDTAALSLLVGYAPPATLDDILAGTPGDDVLKGGYGNDIYLFGVGSGHDRIEEPTNTKSGELNRATVGARDAIRFGPGIAPQDVRVVFNQDALELRLDATGDTLAIGSWDDAAAGRIEFAEFEDGTVWDLGRFAYQKLDLHDEIYFGDAAVDSATDNHGHNALYGGAGNDRLTTGAGDDLLDGGAGNDTLSPGTGDNRIRFGRGFGLDTLNRFGLLTALGADTVVFGEDVAIADIRLRRGINAGLVLELAGTPDMLIINGPLRRRDGADRLRFEFADGTLWGADEIEAHVQAVALIEGGTGDNVLTGGDADDLFVGHEGNDTMSGGGGADTYLYSRGDGIDIVSDRDPRIVFGDGIAPADVTLAGSSFPSGQQNLLLFIAGGGQVTAAGWFDTVSMDGRIEFADGTVWDAAYVGSRVPYAWTAGPFGQYYGTAGSDAYAAGEANDTMRAHAGDDVLSGNGGNDQLYGGAGDDALSGGAGDDSLNGEAGNDTLTGGEGVDTLRGYDGDDLLDGGAGDDLLEGDVGADVLRGGTGDDRMAGGTDDDLLEGGDGADVLEGGLGDDLLDGGAGADRLYGGLGSDAYRFGIGSGADTLLDYDGTGADVDAVLLGEGVGQGDLVVTREAGDIVIAIGSSGDRLAVRSFGRDGYGIERLVFADGSEWSGTALAALAGLSIPRERADVVYGTPQADVLAGLGGDDFIDGAGGDDFIDGGAGNDVLEGGAGDDALHGGPGADHLTGGAGADRFVVAAGDGSDSIADLLDGDTLRFGPGIAAVDVRIARDIDHLYLELGLQGQFVTLEDWLAQGAGGEVLFDDGTAWNGAFLKAKVDALTEGDDFHVGGAAGEAIESLGGLDVVHAGGGDDVVHGGGGSDTLLGDAGADTLYGEAGYDLLFGGEGDDTLEGGADDDALYGDSGNDVLRGGDGYDELSGDAGDDVLEGGAGDDLLQGGRGSDTYLFAPGFGLDTLEDTSSGSGDVDVAYLHGVSPDDVSFTSHGIDFLLEIESSTDTLLLRDAKIPHLLGVDSIVFDDGTVWTAPDVYPRTTRFGTEGGDNISGAFRALVGLGGDDTLNGGFNDNRIEGGEGNDTLTGFQGSDLLLGGPGGDTYRFGVNYGNDIVREDDEGSAGADTLNLLVGRAGTYIYRSGQDIVISLAGGADTLTLQSWYDGAAHQVEILRFADGTSWNAQTLGAHADANLPPESGASEPIAPLSLDEPEAFPQPAALAVAVAGFTPFSDFVRGTGGDDLMEALAGNDTAYGGPGNDGIDGGEGDDYLGGESGDDLLDGGPGRDILEGGAGNDRYAFGAGYGEDWIVDVGGVDEVVIDATIALASVAFTRDLANLYLSAGADRLVLVDWFHRAETRVEYIRAAAGSALDEAAVRLALSVPAATTAHDTIFGSDRGETLLGLAGEDTLYGEGGDDALDGGAGSDYLIGGEGDDTYYVDNRLDRVAERAGEGDDTVIATVSYVLGPDIENLALGGTAAIVGTGNALANTLVGNGAANVLRGGGGDDVLRGGAGNDAYLYDRGDGNDTIEDLDATPGNLDELRFGAGIDGVDVRVARIDNDIRLRLRQGGQVLLAGWYDPASRVERVRFADGTSWDEAMLEHLASQPSNEPPELAQPIADMFAHEDAAFDVALQPGTFVDFDADTLAYEATQADGAPLPAWLQFDEEGASFSGTPANEDVGEYTIRVTATDFAGESVSDEFVLTVVNVNDAPELRSPLADQSVAAGAAFSLALDEAMYLDVDPGDALAFDASRADGSALPDWLAFDAATRTFTGTPSASDAGPLDVRVTATDLAGASASDEFRITVTDSVPDDGHIAGTDRADVLVGTRGSDVLDGLKGHDFLLGLNGDDTYLYRRGDGHDWILESGGKDRLRFGEGIEEDDIAASRRHGDLVLTVKGGEGSVTVKNWFLAASKRVERVEFADGAAWGEGELRGRARRSHDDGWFEWPPHSAGREEASSRDGGHRLRKGKARDEDRHGFRDARGLIDARLHRPARFDFSALAVQSRGEGKPGAMGEARNARHWDAVRRAVALLALDDEDAALGWHGDHHKESIERWNAAHGWGHDGSTGRRTGFAGLRTFSGLGEGFRSLG